MMTTTPARLLLAALACALLVPASAADIASAAARYPTVSKISPTKLGIGDTLTVTGKNFRKGKRKNTVVFRRDGGRAIFVRVTKSATTKRLQVKVPAKLLPFLQQKKGVAQYTRFRVRVLAARFGKAFTALKKSPRIGPVSIGAKASKDDCDGDGVENAKDADDDNDLLSDTLEKEIGTDACKRDSDGDGMSDGWEYRSALDRNSGRAAGAKPSPNRKPYTNPLDPKDASLDQDGDGLTNLEEYAAWATFSNVYRTAPAGGSVLTYSGGNPASDGRSAVPAALAYMDRDANGILSDLERDADGDGIPNLDEDGLTALSRLVPDEPRLVDFGFFSSDYIAKAEAATKADAYRCGGINQVPFYCVDRVSGGKVDTQKVDPLDWLAKDTDGDGVDDAADDQDHDDVDNMTEYRAELATAGSARGYAELDACKPSTDAQFCLISGVDVDGDGVPNGADADDDGDNLTDVLEQQIGTNPLLADTDGDAVSDGYEYASARDLNSSALPYPGKRPYPNPLDASDATSDFDGDGLTLTDEFQAWLYTGGGVPLSYSDGLQISGGQTVRDDLRDVDDDGLTNFDEAHGSLSGPGWWDQWIAEKANKCADDYTESPYPSVTYAGLSFVDPDTDGDGLKDGADDIDHDGVSNRDEAVRPANWCAIYVSSVHNAGDADHSHKYARVNPFNPCKPVYSGTCHQYPPFGYYKDTEDWVGPQPD